MPPPADAARRDRVQRDSLRRDSVRLDSLRRDSVARAAADSARTANTPLSALDVANPADSANAAGFAVYVAGGNTPESATQDVDASSLSTVAALTAVLDRGAPWYRMLVGAYPSRPQADSALASLQRRGVIGASSGQVVFAPYALRLASRLPASQAPERVRALATRNVPAYVLSHGDGTVSVYAGAFEQRQDAAWLARELRKAGVATELVYRTGRSL